MNSCEKRQKSGECGDRIWTNFYYEVSHAVPARPSGAREFKRRQGFRKCKRQCNEKRNKGKKLSRVLLHQIRSFISDINLRREAVGISKVQLLLVLIKHLTIQILFTNPVRVANKTQGTFITKINYLMSFKEIIDFYSDNHTKTTSTYKKAQARCRPVVCILSLQLFDRKLEQDLVSFSRIQEHITVFTLLTAEESPNF